MKTIKKVSLLFASLALVLGAGLVGNRDTKEVKAEAETLTINNSNGPWVGNGSGYKTGTGTMATSNNADVSIKFTNVMKQSNNIQIKGGTSNCFYSTSTISNKIITSIKITRSSTDNPCNLYMSVNGSTWTSAIAVSDKSTTQTYTIEDNYGYFKVGATRGFATLSAIEITYDTANAEKVNPDSITIDESNPISLKTNETKKINVTFKSNEGKEVTETGLKYEITSQNPENVVSVDASGNIKGLNAGNAQLKVTSTAVDTVFATCDIVVTEDLSTKELWTKVTDVSDLKVGDMIVVTNGEDKALSINGENNRSETTITLNGDDVEIDSSVQRIVLEEGKISGSYAFNVSNGYLYSGGGTGSKAKNYLQTESTISENGSFKVELADDGAATITSQGTAKSNIIRYNTSGWFSCYASSSNIKKPVYIYKGVDSTELFKSDWNSAIRENENSLCGFLKEENSAALKALIARYGVLEDTNKADLVDKAGVKISDSITYAQNVWNNMQTTEGNYGNSGVIITSNYSIDSTSLIALFALLGIGAISAYYFIEKKKLSK